MQSIEVGQKMDAEFLIKIWKKQPDGKFCLSIKKWNFLTKANLLQGYSPFVKEKILLSANNYFQNNFPWTNALVWSLFPFSFPLKMQRLHHQYTTFRNQARPWPLTPNKHKVLLIRILIRTLEEYQYTCTFVFLLLSEPT